MTDKPLVKTYLAVVDYIIHKECTITVHAYSEQNAIDIAMAKFEEEYNKSCELMGIKSIDLVRKK